MFAIVHKMTPIATRFVDEKAAGDVADNSLSVGKRGRRIPLCKPALSEPAYEQDKVKLEEWYAR